MLNEINVVLVGAAAGFLSGVAGLTLSRRGQRRISQLRSESHEELAWEQHHSAELATNLLVLEVVSDEIESSEVDVAVRARLSPTELRAATATLEDAELIERSPAERLRLTEVGRSVLNRHKLEFAETLLQRREQAQPAQPAQSSEDLDIAIENAVQTLRARHAQ
jgi:DNA-binding MarR family transcriptional regulator